MEKVVCVDLRRFDPESRDHGVGAYLERLSFMPSALCFLNFHVMFVLEYEDRGVFRPACQHDQPRMAQHGI